MNTLRAALTTVCLIASPLVALAVEERPDSIPPIHPDCNLIDKAAVIIRTHAGEEFFSRYVQFRGLYLQDLRGAQVIRMRAVGSHHDASYDARPEVYYRFDWEFRFGPGRRAGVSFDMDPTGRLLDDPASLTLPPCAERPEECIFGTTREAARDAALNANSAAGYRDFTEFLWSRGFRSFVWAVQLFPPGVEPRQSGIAPPDGARYAIVDANTGEVLKSGPWTRYGQTSE